MMQCKKYIESVEFNVLSRIIYARCCAISHASLMREKKFFRRGLHGAYEIMRLVAIRNRRVKVRTRHVHSGN